MAEVTRRFLAASGPVTREDFARWWGMPSPARGRRLLEALGDEVVRVEVEGTAAYALAADLPGLAEAGAAGRPRAPGRARSGCCPPSTSTWSPPPSRPSSWPPGRVPRWS